MVHVKPVIHPLLDLNGVPTHSSQSNPLPLRKPAVLHQCVDMAAPKTAPFLRLLETHDPTNTPLLNPLNLLRTLLHFSTLTPLRRSMDS